MDGVPFVRIEDFEGTFLSASRLEVHRLASAYVMNGKVGDATARRVVLTTLSGEEPDSLSARTGQSPM
jgi:hypothetical protein